MTSIRALLAASFASVLLVNAALPVAAEDAVPRAGFAYGTILNALDNAPLARDGGFTLMSAYVAWRAVEPSRGQYIFEQQDQWGRTAANDLTNVLNAARGSGLKVGLRLDAPPEWAGGSVYRLDPAGVEDYVYDADRHGLGTIAY